MFVPKETGKGLSTNDFTTAEKEKLAGIEDNANNYVLPDATTTTKGGVLLSTSTSSASTTTAATSSAVKSAYDLADSKQSPATTLSGYGIEDAYTKQDIDNKGYQNAQQVQSLIANSSHLKREKVTTLPDASTADVNTIYMVPKSGSTGDVFNEYMVIDGKFELVGNSEVDLSGYLQKTDVTPITNAEIDTIVAS